MNDQQILLPSEVIQTENECWNTRDVDGVAACYAEDVVAYWPILGRLDGRAAVREQVASFLAAAPDLHVELEKILAEDETVFVHWRATFTFSGAAHNGLSATGRSIDLRGNDCFTVRDGEIISAFVAFDGIGSSIQAGLLPAPGTIADRAMKAAMNALTALRRRLGR